MKTTAEEVLECVDEFLDADWYYKLSAERCGVSPDTIRRFTKENVLNMNYSTVFAIFHGMYPSDDLFPLPSPEKLRMRLANANSAEIAFLRFRFGVRLYGWRNGRLGMSAKVGCDLIDAIKILDTAKQVVDERAANGNHLNT